MSLLTAAVAASMVFPLNSLSPVLPDYGATPTINLSAIRLIRCGGGAGTGFLIADNTLVTALHVVENRACVDHRSGKPLYVYHVDRDHDLVLAKVELKDFPYIRYDCERFITGNNYSSYGYSGYLQNYNIFRQSNLKAYSDYSGPGFKVNTKQGLRDFPKMRHLFGPMVYGHSGGPVIDPVTGMAKGINNAGLTTFLGLMTGHAYSTELADTILCKR